MNVVTLDADTGGLIVVGRVLTMFDPEATKATVVEFPESPKIVENTDKPIELLDYKIFDYNFQACWTPFTGRFIGMAIFSLQDIIYLEEAFKFEYVCELYPFEKQ